MKQKSYLQAASIIFIVFAALHGLRVLNGWEVNISTFEVPMSVSWVVVPVALYLAYQGMKLMDKK